MKRRSFLRLAAAAAASKPQKVSDLNLVDVATVPGQLGHGPITNGPVVSSRGNDISVVQAAKEGLRSLAVRTPAEAERFKQRVDVYALSVNAAALRSVNLQTKINMTREQPYASHVRAAEQRFRGVIDGLWDY